jgi:flavin reductase (DIM6/NTAB) family NADH-FMN oxidoreductase RutF
MQEVLYNQPAEKALATLSKGAFLTASHGGKRNVMTIAWGSLGFMWGKPVFMIMVRPSRYTYQLLEASGEFAVSIPAGAMEQALSVCGAKSGRDTDKFAAASLDVLPGKNIATPIIAGCGLYYECKIIYKQAMNPVAADQVNTQWYANGDHHTMYYGEIVAAYTNEADCR